MLSMALISPFDISLKHYFVLNAKFLIWEESHLVEWDMQSKHSGELFGPNFYSESL